MAFVFTEYLSEAEEDALSPEAQEVYIAWCLERMQNDVKRLEEGVSEIREGFSEIREGFSEIREGYKAINKRLDYFEALSAQND